MDTDTYMHPRTHPHAHAHEKICMHIQIHESTQENTHIRTNTQTYIYTHTPRTTHDKTKTPIQVEILSTHLQAGSCCWRHDKGTAQRANTQQHHHRPEHHRSPRVLSLPRNVRVWLERTLASCNQTPLVRVSCTQWCTWSLSCIFKLPIHHLTIVHQRAVLDEIKNKYPDAGRGVLLGYLKIRNWNVSTFYNTPGHTQNYIHTRTRPRAHIYAHALSNVLAWIAS